MDRTLPINLTVVLVVLNFLITPTLASVDHCPTPSEIRQRNLNQWIIYRNDKIANINVINAFIKAAPKVLGAHWIPTAANNNNKYNALCAYQGFTIKSKKIYLAKKITIRFKLDDRYWHKDRDPQYRGMFVCILIPNQENKSTVTSNISKETCPF